MRWLALSLVLAILTADSVAFSPVLASLAPYALRSAAVLPNHALLAILA
jgi:hypothetical protein